MANSQSQTCCIYGKMKATIKVWLKRLLRPTPFYPVHMGAYIRGLYFWREIKKLPVAQFRKVFDAGCGPGHYALEFARCYPHVQVVGHDLKAEFLTEGKPPNLRLEHRDLLTLEATEDFDFVCSI